MKKINVFIPATVSNVACGFDILGFPIESFGDAMVVRKTDKKGLKITKVKGYDIPLDISKNVATVSAMKLLDDIRTDYGFEFEITKNIIPGSGIGSSGASAAGSVYAINKLLGDPFSNKELIKYAMGGEVISSVSEHADNVAPALLGGLVMVKSINPQQIINLPLLPDLFCFIINPKIQVKTSYSREILPSKIDMNLVTSQVSNFGGLIHSLHTKDYDLLKFDEVKEKCLELGSLGCSISGSGPSIFAITKGEDLAKKIEKEVTKIYQETNIEFSTYISKISSEGVSVIDSE